MIIKNDALIKFVESILHFDHLVSTCSGRPESGLTYFWITDSCPMTVKEVKNKAPFEVLSLATSIATTLQI